MKEIAIVSGKGGTGKTTICAAFAGVTDAALADCDVDASNLPLVLSPQIVTEEEFKGSKIAVKNTDLCTECGECRRVCRVKGIDKNFDVIPVRCEGCGTCTLVCPSRALALQERVTGRLFVSNTRLGPLVHAALHTGEEASGKLVTRVREVASQVAETESKELILIDGSPGIGCPVIASIVGCKLAILVTEPTLSGIFDLDRIYQVINHFNIPCGVCINKFDLNPKNADRIKDWCSQKDIPLVGTLPYNPVVTELMVSKKTLTEYNNAFYEKFDTMWSTIESL